MYFASSLIISGFSTLASTIKLRVFALARPNSPVHTRPGRSPWVPRSPAHVRMLHTRISAVNVEQLALLVSPLLDVEVALLAVLVQVRLELGVQGRRWHLDLLGPVANLRNSRKDPMESRIHAKALILYPAPVLCESVHSGRWEQ